MKTFDVQAIGLDCSADTAFAFIADPANLPQWTNAFVRADATSADMATPSGEMAIGLKTLADKTCGTVDWIMTMPDGSVGAAYSRIVPDGDDKSIYSFVLMAPPVPLEMLEGALEAQIGILAEELKHLKAKLAA